jgi:tetratricopeptide (TPR) repeat protein
MSLLGRFLGGGRNKASAEGVTHLEEGRYSEAVACLRGVALDKSDTPSGSLVSFHFRQALLGEGRRLLRGTDKSLALPLFAEAVGLWGQYPDLHCLFGMANGLVGDWSIALTESRKALRLNPDYAEARLLEAVALQKMERDREAGESLNSLAESGRRVDHWLIDELVASAPFDESNLPSDLAARLERSLSGQSEKEEMAAAVALCRAGQWEDGLERFAALVERRPRYPDYRTRHAAALYQVGKNEEALSEVEAALALNDTYRTAVDLKGLILAETGRLQEAADFLRVTDENLAEANSGGGHEELFADYLRAVLALLTGRPEDVAPILGQWPGLVHNFARAELLQAAAEHLQGKQMECGRRLTALAVEWSAESLYSYLLACHLLAENRWSEVTNLLGRWPASATGEADSRPLYLAGLVAIHEGRQPSLSQPSGQPIHDDAWQILQARADHLQGDSTRCWQTCQKFAEQGALTESLWHLQLQAGRVKDEVGAEMGATPTVIPDSCLASVVALLIAKSETEDAQAIIARYRRLHPEGLLGVWLDAEFWLAPIRNWIA